MSSALVPRLILLEASTSALCEAPSILSSLSRPALGEIWSSAMGGGLGSLGELEGEAIGSFQAALICSEEKEWPSSCSREGKHAVEVVIVNVQAHARRDLSIPNTPLGTIRPELARHTRAFISSTILFGRKNILTMDPDMDFDDDGPPMLVAADQPNDTEDLSAEVDDMNLTRVPITIITGMQL